MCDPKISLSGENDISFKRVSSKKKRELAFHATMYILIFFKLIIIKIKSGGPFQSNYVFAIDI